MGVHAEPPLCKFWTQLVTWYRFPSQKTKMPMGDSNRSSLKTNCKRRINFSSLEALGNAVSAPTFKLFGFWHYFSSNFTCCEAGAGATKRLQASASTFWNERPCQSQAKAHLFETWNFNFRYLNFSPLVIHKAFQYEWLLAYISLDNNHSRSHGGKVRELKTIVFVKSLKTI